MGWLLTSVSMHKQFDFTTDRQEKWYEAEENSKSALSMIYLDRKQKELNYHRSSLTDSNLAGPLTATSSMYSAVREPHNIIATQNGGAYMTSSILFFVKEKACSRKKRGFNGIQSSSRWWPVSTLANMTKVLYSKPLEKSSSSTIRRLRRTSVKPRLSRRCMSVWRG